jgi:virginiamycin A acetyltransferase
MKPILKGVARGFALIIVAIPWLMCWLGARLFGPVASFTGWSQAFSLLPGLTGVYLRRAFYGLTLPRCEPDVCITFGSVISHPTARFGRRVYVGAFCTLGDIVLEDDVLIGSHVSIANGGAQHGIDSLDLPVREQPGIWPTVTIGRDTWIGDRAVVLADVGQHCVIGAGAVVTKPIPDFAIAVGVPARVIRYRGDRRSSEVSETNSTEEICAVSPE